MGGLCNLEKIDEEKASLYIWRSCFWPETTPLGWMRYEAKVTKDRGKYKLWFYATLDNVEYNLKGEYLVTSSARGSSKFRRVHQVGKASHRAGIQRQGQSGPAFFMHISNVLVRLRSQFIISFRLSFV